MRAVSAGMLACFLVLAVSVMAYAHASLVSSEPAAGSRLSSAPTRVRLLFSEAVEPTMATIVLIDESRHELPLPATGDPHDVHALIAPVTDAAPGAYRLHWRVVSADGHPVEGSFTFFVGANETAAPPPDVAGGTERATWGPTMLGAPLLPAALRALAVGVLMCGTGLLLFASTGRERDRSSLRRPMRMAKWLLFLAPLLLALHAVAWIMNAVPEHALTTSTMTAALSSGVGTIELWRTGLALLAAWALLLARRPKLALLCAFAALAVSGATGHSAAIQPAWAMPAKGLHLIAGSIWVGGVLYLIAFDSSDRTAFTRAAFRVSNAALWCLFVVALSGIVQTRLFDPTIDGVLHSSYGALVLAKVAGLLILFAFGARHRRRTLPRLETGANGNIMAASLRGEMLVMLLVIALGGLLAYVAPPRHMAMPMPMDGGTSHPTSP